MSASLSSYASLQSAQSTITVTTPCTSINTLPNPHAPSRSLSFLVLSKNKFSSLVRTHNRRTSADLTTKDQEIARDTNPSSVVGVLTGYANDTMLTSRENEPARRKSENKLYNFFRPRSRSRSKSNARRSQSADPPILPSSPAPPLPNATSSHTRHSSIDEYENRVPPTLSINVNSKPRTRSQSRPLSTTTTGTHSTITSLVTPTQTRKGRSKGKKLRSQGGSSNGGRGTLRPASTSSSVDLDTRPSTETSASAPSSPFHTPPTSLPPDSIPAASSLSAATSKQPTSTRIRLHNLFGIPLTNPRRSSFGSRSTSNTNTPIPSSSNLPITTTSPQPLSSKYADLISPPQSRPGSAHRRATTPNPSPSQDESHVRTKEKEKAKRRSATAPASWLSPRFFSGSGSGSTVDRDRAYPGSSSPPPHPSSMLTAVNGDSTSTLQTQTTHTHGSSGAGDRGMSSSIHAPRPQSRSDPIPPVPKITHTSPTPQKGGSGESSMGPHRRSITSPTGNSVHGRNRSLVVYGQEGLNALSEEMEREERGKVLRQREEKGKESKRGRWSPKFFGGSGDGSRDKGKEKERASRVSSPIDGPLHGNGNGNVPSLSRRNSRIKHGSFGFEGSRPLSGLSSTAMGGKVAASSPPVTKSMSRELSKDGKLERTVSFSQSHSHAHTHPKHGRDRTPSTSPHMHRRGLPDTGPSNHTGASAHSTHNKKPTPTPPASVGLSSSWGSATTTKSTVTAPSNGSANGKRRAIGLAHGSFAFEPAVPPPSSPITSEFGVIRSGDSGYQESAASAATSASTNGGHRGKGRSLDLNIGLSWAPTKVKQEAVMSSFLEMNGKDRKCRDREEEKRTFESGVSEIFRNVLGEGGFATFKKYIRRFDAQLIPFDGPSGLITRVEKLLNNAPPPGLDAQERQELMDRFITVVLQNA